MRLDYAFENPPYSIGGKIAEYSLKSLAPDGSCVCLMPLSQYKSGLYKHVESFELADPKMFSDADITNNLCICVLRSSEVGEYKTYNDLFEMSFVADLKAFYLFNSPNKWKTTVVRCDSKESSDFDVNKDFIEGGRLPDADTGLCKNQGLGHDWNIMKNDKAWNSCVCCIHFESENACNNFRTFAYGCRDFYNRILWGLRIKAAGELMNYAIPQINWETISDHPLWVQGDYDGAVLDVMGLKWNEDKSGVLNK